MAITRRQFIRRTGLATAGAFLGPSFFRTPFLRRALADSLTNLDRYFVVIFLDGGNDGLNTVTPIGDGTSGGLRAAYEAMRTAGTGGLRLLQPDLAATALGAPLGNDTNTGTPLALHPGLIGLKHLWDANALAVVQGCGDPVTLNFLSHEFSRSVWQTANPRGAAGFSDGWVGRYLQNAGYAGSDIPGVCIRDSVAPELLTTATSVLAINRLANFGFPYDDTYPADQSFKRNAFLDLYTQASGSAQPTFKYIGDSGSSTLRASESYPALDTAYVTARPTFNQAYDDLGTGFAQDLREIAKIIYGVKNSAPNVTARCFELANGGYDTHSDQGTNGINDQHNQLHLAVGNAVEAFYNDCLDMGVANKLCIVIWSEFSRRIQQNATGTDHGSQGPVFVIGGGVHKGLYGNHPNIASVNGDGNTKYSQDPSDPFRSTDIRDVYGTLLKHWLGIANPAALLPVDPGPPGDPDYWTSPNFDLPFLT